MKSNKWNNIHHVVVVGLGITGLSVIRHLQSLPHSLSIQAIDTRESPAGIEQVKEIPLHTGGWQLDWLLNADLIVLAPGIALATPEIQQAIKKGIPVIGDIELFAWAVDAPVVAITGSNGKSTVTDLTGVLAKTAGVNVAVGGNIGVPALDLLSDDNLKDGKTELYVLELSSFQLETTSSLSLVAAAYLNLSEDHMDRYNGMQDYGDAKQRIFAHAQTAIVNREDKQTYPALTTSTNNISTNHTPAINMQTVSFGLDKPTSSTTEEFGIITKNGKEYLAKGEQPLLAVEELKLVGRHNLANSLVALALLDSVKIDGAKVDLSLCFPALTEYSGLTHRCQVVAQKNGVTWVNDSKATNVASTLAALSGLSLTGKLHLLVGGLGKGADFSVLKNVFNQLNIQLYCFGKDGQSFVPLHSSAKYYPTMEDAVLVIRQNTQSGDIVMLSPACASLDQFKNFMARGERFTELAQQLV